MSLVHKLKTHLCSVGLTPQQIEVVGSFLRTRKDPAKSIKGILTLSAQQINDQVIAPHVLKRIGERVVDDINCGRYSVIQSVSGGEYSFNVVVWDKVDESVVGLIVDFISGKWPSGVYPKGEYSVALPHVDQPISFSISTMTGDHEIVKNIFAKCDKMFSGFADWEKTLPNAIYCVELLEK